MENLHIIFWLFKDVSWCMGWKLLGTIFIIPTLIISIVIAWRTRNIVSELCHNLAITLWISANSLWMITEFIHLDNVSMGAGFTYKQLALIPFIAGLIIIGYYYLIWKPRNPEEAETM
jgi:hypothetical protein